MTLSGTCVKGYNERVPDTCPSEVLMRLSRVVRVDRRRHRWPGFGKGVCRRTRDLLLAWTTHQSSSELGPASEADAD